NSSNRNHEDRTRLLLHASHTATSAWIASSPHPFRRTAAAQQLAHIAQRRGSRFPAFRKAALRNPFIAHGLVSFSNQRVNLLLRLAEGVLGGFGLFYPRRSIALDVLEFRSCLVSLGQRLLERGGEVITSGNQSLMIEFRVLSRLERQMPVVV